LNDSDVRVRDLPTTEESNTLGTLKKGTEVAVLGRSEFMDKVSDMPDYWLRIRPKDGAVG
jgi:hypothetical protein